MAAGSAAGAARSGVPGCQPEWYWIQSARGMPPIHLQASPHLHAHTWPPASKSSPLTTTTHPPTSFSSSSGSKVAAVAAPCSGAAPYSRSASSRSCRHKQAGSAQPREQPGTTSSPPTTQSIPAVRRHLPCPTPPHLHNTHPPARPATRLLLDFPEVEHLELLAARHEVEAVVGLLGDRVVQQAQVLEARQRGQGVQVLRQAGRQAVGRGTAGHRS